MTRRPNIVLIMADNQPADMLGCYGNDDVHTPQLDALATGGTRFDSAFCVNAMCSPCRASVLTGLMPSAHGVHTWLDDGRADSWPQDWNAIGEFPTLPGQLRNAGYDTALIGKYHLGQPWQAPADYDHWVTFPHGHTVSFHGNLMIENDHTEVFEGHSVDFLPTAPSITSAADRIRTRPFSVSFLSTGLTVTGRPFADGPARSLTICMTRPDSPRSRARG